MVQDLDMGIADCSQSYRLYKNNPFEQKKVLFEQYGMGTQVLITEISYHNDGIDVRYMKKKGFNFALRAQDLFYDFQIVQWLFENYKDYLSELSHVIIGLSYYSFEYDLSKSRNGYEALRYYPHIPTLHNCSS